MCPSFLFVKTYSMLFFEGGLKCGQVNADGKFSLDTRFSLFRAAGAALVKQNTFFKCREGYNIIHEDWCESLMNIHLVELSNSTQAFWAYKYILHIRLKSLLMRNSSSIFTKC